MAPLPNGLPPRIRIEDPRPLIDCGRHPSKACVGDDVQVFATVFADGHDVLRAVARYRPVGTRRWSEAPMRRIDAHVDGDRWAGTITLDAPGLWEWSVEAWVDPFASWREELRRKLAFGETSLDSELSEGAGLLAAAAAPARGADAAAVVRAAALLGDATQPLETRAEAGLDPALAAIVAASPARPGRAQMGKPARIAVDRVRARFGAWYELFPRSFGGLRGVAEQLPRLAELGFDVLYLPPIQPIGVTNRKGANNALVAAPEDPGSPWAIGGPEGGHTAIHPELGTLEDFDALIAAAGEHDLEIALDFAIQCSADHPWLTEHPEWFHHRPDGSLKYAENPPKKYQDIYNVDFGCDDWQGLWSALRDVVLFWAEHGVRIFRVDNPHTKPLPFWEWLIAEVRAEHPDVLFLAEAFTRQAMMSALAKVGFSQSYTYFTWKNSRWELTEYVEQLAHSGLQDFYRPNFFVNTPDILSEYLQHGGPPAFTSRLVLGATLSPSYGLYSGFESFENVAVRPGSEEYLDSEKYAIKERDLDGPLLPLVARLNAVRRAHPALQRLDNVTFLATENDALIAYAKRTGDDVVLVVVSIDPVFAQAGVAVVPYDLGLAPAFAVEDLLTGERFDWRIGPNFVRLEPPLRMAHVLRVLA